MATLAPSRERPSLHSIVEALRRLGLRFARARRAAMTNASHLKMTEQAMRLNFHMGVFDFVYDIGVDPVNRSSAALAKSKAP